MADVQPFRAVHYARASPAVVAPPYDVVSAEECVRLLAQDPHNVAHLTMAPDASEAGRLYREWLDTGVLVREDHPAIWVLEQNVNGTDGAPRRRRGVVASLRAEPYERRVVVPHERTHAEPIASRLRLLRAVRSQLEPLFFLYEGEAPVHTPDGPPDVEAGGTRLWRLPDGAEVEAFFRERQVLIADGHHRYETSLAFAQESGGAVDARVLAVLVSTADPGLLILATHRVFDGRPDLLANPAFVGEPCADVAEAMARLEAEPAGRAAAVRYTRGGTSLVRGTDGELDVQLVARAGLTGISYTVDLRDAVGRVDAAGADCAFLLRPTPIEEVFAHARRGEVMPPKTTYFYPKLTSGLLFHPLDD